jgi:hypothetical protein
MEMYKDGIDLQEVMKDDDTKYGLDYVCSDIVLDEVDPLPSLNRGGELVLIDDVEVIPGEVDVWGVTWKRVGVVIEGVKRISVVVVPIIIPLVAVVVAVAVFVVAVAVAVSFVGFVVAVAVVVVVLGSLSLKGKVEFDDLVKKKEVDPGESCGGSQIVNVVNNGGIVNVMNNMNVKK